LCSSELATTSDTSSSGPIWSSDFIQEAIGWMSYLCLL
jgi:hypothetical protein